MLTLYDFLFVDHERMRSLYAQLYEGLLDAMTFDRSIAEVKENELQVGGDPAGHASKRRSMTKEEVTHDNMVPHDLVLRDVLSGLTERNLIVKKHLDMKVGSIALVQGKLSVLDVRKFLQYLNKMPEVLLENGSGDNDPGRRVSRHKNREQTSNKKKMYEAAISTISPLTQLRIDADDLEVWAAIGENGMRVSVDNLTMQHGIQIPGVWNILGIVDDLGNGDNDQGTTSRPLPKLFDGLETAMEALKMMFSRPIGAVCVTPLVVFRTICPE